MRKITLIVVALLIASGFCFAQKTIKVKDVDLNDPQSIQTDVPRGAVYTFDEFTDGRVFFKNGASSSAKLNYNTLIEEMQFITDKDEVLTVANPDQVLYIKIGDKYFYHLRGNEFTELLVNANVLLCVKRKTEVSRQKKDGAYGQSSATAAVDDVKRFSDNFMVLGGTIMKNYEFEDVRSNVTLRALDEFYVKKGDKMSKITNKSTIIKAFPEYKNEINEYFEQTNVNLKNEQDLIKLVTHLSEQRMAKN